MSQLHPADFETYQDYLLAWARHNARSNTQDWPGTPINHIPLSKKNDLHALVAAGRATIVTRPSKRNPERTVSYLVVKGA
jgi:hypothetical protein